MEAHINGPAITPRGDPESGPYYFRNPNQLDAAPLEEVDVGAELWISMPGNLERFTGWVVALHEHLAAAELDIEPGTAAPVFADGKQWMIYVRAPGDALVLELIDVAPGVAAVPPEA